MRFRRLAQIKLASIPCIGDGVLYRNVFEVALGLMPIENEFANAYYGRRAIAPSAMRQSQKPTVDALLGAVMPAPKH